MTVATALRSGLCLSALLAASPLAHAETRLDARARFEAAKFGGLAERSEAYTLRLAARHLQSLLPTLGVTAAVEWVQPLSLGHYNDGVHGPPDRPPIADPALRAIDQLSVDWQANSQLQLRLGRQWWVIDQQRHIGGGPAWRQHNQSYDALSLRWVPMPKVTIEGAHARQVNRPLGPDSPQGTAEGQFNMWAALWLPAPDLTAVGYGVWLDFDRGSSIAPGAGTETIGVRLEHRHPLHDFQLRWRLEAARQRAHAEGTLADALWMRAAETSVLRGAVNVSVGAEQLDGDGERGFSTPFAALHAVNGWADRFIATPAVGLVDRWISVSRQDQRTRLQLAYHDFRAARGGDPFGVEWNWQVGYLLRPDLRLLIKHASYLPAGRAPVGTGFADLSKDLRRSWIQLEWWW